MTTEPAIVVSGDTASVRGGRPLQGPATVPGDKSISHRALLLAALGEGRSTILGLSPGEDVRRTHMALTALGASVRAGPDSVAVDGGRALLGAPATPIDLGNSGTGMRLLAGVLAAVNGTTVLTGDASLRRRPMDRVAEPLGQMGATVVGQGTRCLPPLRITGGILCGIEYTPPMASAQVKSAILLAGTGARGPTVIHEPVPTRAHTEEMLALAGADITVDDEDSCRTIRLQPGPLHPTVTTVPGDPSQAAFWLVAGTVVAGSHLRVTGVHLGAERIGFVSVLQRMGAAVTLCHTGPDEGTLEARHTRLTGTVIAASEIPSLDEVPVLAVAGALSEGVTRFSEVGELRLKESDRLEATAAMVRAFGGLAAIDGEDLVITGVGFLHAGTIDAGGDHRIAMAAAIAGAACPAGHDPTIITGWGAVATSDPGFASVLNALAGSPASEGSAR